MKPFASFIPRCLNTCLLSGLLLSGSISAQTIDAPLPVSVSSQAGPAYVTEARKAIDAVLAEPEFDRTQTIKVPKLKTSPTDKKKSFFDTFFKWLEKLLRNNKNDLRELPEGSSPFAKFGQVVLWLLVFGLIVLLMIYAKHWLPFFGWRRSRAGSLPPVQQTDSALEFSETLPEDIVTATERCWEEGKKDKALSLLYRGAIELLTTYHRVDLPQGATEEEIRLLVGRAMPSLKDDFGNIARAWLRLAYAHRPPADIIDLLAGFGRLRQAGEAAA
ncbi:MAG: DUF4129 domain-containing protein [Betaproteobacteria bacterium]|jgi:hypothetical protein|nr:DUF4129 domain-containing protein [Betaproteobacteria bacterium]